jgi:hypothetical protein
MSNWGVRIVGICLYCSRYSGLQDT